MSLAQEGSTNFDLTITADLWPKQAELLEAMAISPATTIGMGGARGGGKSHSGRKAIYTRRFQYENTNALIFRRTWKELRENHVKPLFAEHPWLKRYYVKNEHTIYLPRVNSQIVFGTAEHEDDILDYHGQAYADILVDESQRCTPWMIEKLKESNRCTTNDRITPKMILNFNPGDISHAYHKRVFIDRSYIENEDPNDFLFIQAFGWDNPVWVFKALKKDKISVQEYLFWPSQKRMLYFATKSDYGRKLARLSDTERRAQMFGDFNIYAGMFFSMLRRDIHYVKPFDIPEDWNKLATIDWGQRAVLEIQAADHRGRVWNFGEVYTEHEAPAPRAIQMAEYLMARKLYNLDIQYDTNMEIDLTEAGYNKGPLPTFIRVFNEIMGDKAPRLFKVSKNNIRGKDYRAGCNDIVKDYLHFSQGRDTKVSQQARVFITYDCPKLWESITSLQHPQKNPTGWDFDKTIGLQDPFDAFKMTLAAIIPAKELEKPREQEWYEQLHPANPRTSRLVNILDPFNV